MGSINIDFLKKDDRTKTSHLYSDVHLDLENDYAIRGNYKKSETNLIDIKISYDIEAIKNSLTALFSTYPGQRLLLPSYGVSIQRYIFSPVSDGNARLIGEQLNNAISLWEPRVAINRINISPKKQDHRYDIVLDMYVPSLKESANFVGSIIEGDGFIRG